MLHHVLRGLIIAVLITGFAASGQAQGLARAMNASSIVGTWTGESICVGNRPACKNETVVYRFEPVPGRSTFVTLLADKIIKGKRIPMYKLDFQYDESKRTLSATSRRDTRTAPGNTKSPATRWKVRASFWQVNQLRVVLR